MILQKHQRKMIEMLKSKRDSLKDRRRSRNKQRQLRRTQMIQARTYSVRRNSTDRKVTQNLDSLRNSHMFKISLNQWTARLFNFVEDFMDQELLEAICSSLK